MILSAGWQTSFASHPWDAKYSQTSAQGLRQTICLLPDTQCRFYKCLVVI
jgi:hypothetical protein